MGSGEVEESFRKRLREERELRGLSQADLARKLSDAGLSVHPTTVAKVEAGDRAVRIAEAAVIADIFEFSLDEALGRTVNDDNEFVYRFRSLQEKAREALVSIESLQMQFHDRLATLLEFTFTDHRDRIEANGGNAIASMESTLSALVPIADMGTPVQRPDEKLQPRKREPDRRGKGLGRGLARLFAAGPPGEDVGDGDWPSYFQTAPPDEDANESET